MKNPKRTLIILLVCVAGLTAVLLGLHFAPSSGGSSSSGSSLQTTVLYSHKDSDLVSMTVTNAAGTYTIEPDKAATAKAVSAAAASKTSSAASGSTSSAAAAKTVFKVRELNGIEIDTATAGTAAQEGYNLSALKNIGAAASLSDYGLQKPATQFTSTFTDGSKVTVLIGNVTALDASSRYIKMSGSDNIYTATVADALLKGTNAYVSPRLISLSGTADNTSASSSSTAAANMFTKIDVKDAAGTIALARSGQAWTVNGRAADSEKVSTLAGTLTSLSGTSVEAVHPTEQQLKTFGLASPAAELTYTAKSGTATLLVGSQKTGSVSSQSESSSSSDVSYYAMLKGGNKVCLVESTALPWLTEKAFDLQQLSLIANTQTDISNLMLQGNGINYNISVSRTKNESSSTEDVAAYTYSTAVNGKKISNESNYAQFFTKLLNLKILEDSSETPAGEPAATLTMTGYDTKIRHVYQFYKVSDRRYFVKADGIGCGLISSTAYDDMVTGIKAVK
ncbi:MAG: DUF4340 domain-containing protein [Oscillospiraceae bacterium]|nr:DUF4340 domain-containing protein [Oscillospiraceae bacterium]